MCTYICVYIYTHHILLYHIIIYIYILYIYVYIIYIYIYVSIHVYAEAPERGGKGGPLREGWLSDRGKQASLSVAAFIDPLFTGGGL